MLFPLVYSLLWLNICRYISLENPQTALVKFFCSDSTVNYEFIVNNALNYEQGSETQHGGKGHGAWLGPERQYAMHSTMKPCRKFNY